MAWIEVHQSLPSHRKTLALCDALNIKPAQAVGHLTCLWLWSIDNAPDGDLSGVSHRTIARAAQWERNAETFVSALEAAGFMDSDDAIHDWDEYTGKLTEQRELRRQSNREAQARRRQRLSSPSQHDVSADNADSQQSTVPDRTQPNRTGDDRIPPVPTGHPPARGQRRVVTVADDAFRDELETQFCDAFGSREAVSDAIATAMSHRQATRCTDQRAYLRNWIRGDAEKAALRRGVRGTLAVVDATQSEECTCPRIRAELRVNRNAPRTCAQHGWVAHENARGVSA